MAPTRLFPLAFFAATFVAQVAPAAVQSAELYTASSYQYGRFEARLKFAAGDGVVSSFFLWKDGSERTGTFWNELDFEKLGADCHLQTNAYYGSPAVVHTRMQTEVSALCTDFHTYAYEWTPEYIAWSVDGMEIRRETGATAVAYADNATAGMQLRFNIWPGDRSFGGDFSPSILPVQEQIDWVQYSSYADGAFNLEWRDDFDTTPLASRWLTGNWASPKNLSTHDPANVSIGGGNAVLALTSTDTSSSTGGSSAGAPPVGSNQGGGGGGCSTSPGRSGAPSVALAALTLLAMAFSGRRAARDRMRGRGRS
jgi:endo-1,3-1,4-beta-glycanase ExoK